MITCEKFSPNAPEQNPVEDIWLQCKSFIRHFYHFCRSVKIVKWLFKFFTDGQICGFLKLFSVWDFGTTYLGLLYIFCDKMKILVNL